MDYWPEVFVCHQFPSVFTNHLRLFSLFPPKPTSLTFTFIPQRHPRSISRSLLMTITSISKPVVFSVFLAGTNSLASALVFPRWAGAVPASSSQDMYQASSLGYLSSVGQGTGVPYPTTTTWGTGFTFPTGMSSVASVSSLASSILSSETSCATVTQIVTVPGYSSIVPPAASQTGYYPTQGGSSSMKGKHALNSVGHVI